MNMADLFDDLLAFLGHDPAVELVSRGAGHADTETARLGAVLTAPVVLAHFDEWTQGPVGAGWLMARIPAVDASPDLGLTDYVESQDNQQAGDAVLGLVVGDKRKELADAIGTQSGLDASVVDELMCASAWGVLVCLARRFPDRPERAELAETFAQARSSLIAGGWSDWISTTSGDRMVERGRLADPEPLRNNYPPPVSAPLRQSYVPAGGEAEPATSLADERAPTYSAGPPPHTDPTFEEAFARTRDERGSRLGRLTGVPLLLLIAAAAALLALLFWSLSNGGDETVASETVDSDAVRSTPATTDDGDGASSGGETADDGSDDAAGDAASGDGGDGSSSDRAGADTDSGPDDRIVELESLMIDPLERTNGSGTSTIALDRVTGEICYTMVVNGLAEPYDGHIHVGPAGVKGGIIVDFGALTGDSSGCLRSTPTDIESILADPAGHYVELHDAGGVATIRSQLADDTGVVAADEVDGGGAYTMIDAGALRLIGEVPDQVTIDKFIESFADIDLGSTELVNELEIVEGSPRPSGRIVVDDLILFPVDSDVIANPDSTALRDLATILRARPAWRLNVVGHTDDTGPDVYNLELSLRRAEAVRAALVADGVAGEALTVPGAGSTNPIDTNDTPEGRANNRRIELSIIPG